MREKREGEKEKKWERGKEVRRERERDRTALWEGLLIQHKRPGLFIETSPPSPWIPTANQEAGGRAPRPIGVQ